MKERRKFSEDGVKKKVEDYHGGCRYIRTQPKLTKKSVDIELSFEEAMRLSLAIQSALIGLNRHNRSTKAGREMGLLLSIKRKATAISVIEKRVRPADDVDGESP
jgi:hypothetical protein